MAVWRHVGHVLLRIALAVPVAIGLPLAHLSWGHRLPEGGPTALGFLITFALIGLGAGVAYLVVGSVAQYLLRRRVACVTVFVDLAVCVVLTGIMAWAGVTASFVDRDAANAMAHTSPTRKERLR